MKQLIRKFVRTFLNLMENVIIWFGVRVSRLLPTRTWLRIREEGRIVRELDYPRVPTRIVVDSWIEKDVRLHSCAREPGTVDWIENWFKPGDVFYDIGSNVGAYSLIAFQFLSGNIEVLAFEPGFATFPQLCRNIHLNNAEKAITPFPVALSDITAVTAFHYANLVPGGALHALDTPINHRGDVFTPISTLQTLNYKLDDLVEQFSLPLPNHIKIDVDGPEYKVLLGSSNVLTHRELRSILVELEDGQENVVPVEEYLKMKGFLLHSRRHVNLLFCREIK